MATSKNEKLQAQDEEYTMAGKAVQDKKGKKHMKKHEKSMCKHCKGGHKTSEHKKHMKHEKKGKHMKHKKGGLKLNPPSKGHKPKGAHGRAAVKALGRTKTTGNFKAIESKYGKGAAVNAYQNALKAHQHGKTGSKQPTGRDILRKGMKKLSKHK